MGVRTDRLTALVNTFQETAMQRNNNLEVISELRYLLLLIFSSNFSSQFLSFPSFSSFNLPVTATADFITSILSSPLLSSH
jgi:hypothetical protein